MPRTKKRIDNKILKIITKERISTTNEIAGKLEVSWNTVEKHLLELTIKGKIEKIKKLGANLWLPKQKK